VRGRRILRSSLPPGLFIADGHYVHLADAARVTEVIRFSPDHLGRKP
jgi:hypothetical protein